MKVRHISKGDEVLLSNGKVRVWGYTTSDTKHVRAVKVNKEWCLLDDRPTFTYSLIQFLFFPRRGYK